MELLKWEAYDYADLLKRLAERDHPTLPMPLNAKRNPSDPDARELGKLGYVQELFRLMGGFSNFAISFSNS